jgi:poly-gamma-glutamate synthesis protein (capsule biosynthesis protein)
MNFVGDLLLATDEYTSYENCFNDVADVQSPDYFLSQVSDIFFNDDITVGDCENVFSDSDGLSVSDKGQYDAAKDEDFKAFWFKSKSSNANIISAGGVDIVSIDNNHINDYGQQGKEDTKAALEAAGVEWGNSGQTVYKEINGFKIAFIFGSMYNSGQEADILANLNEAKGQSDYQIIYFHGGTEAVHEPEDWKISACHDLVDNGADLILGDHPHVLQPMEEYNGAYIVYSLGNFCFGGNRHPENRTIIFNETLTITKNTSDDTYEITDKTYDITPCYVYTGDTNNWQPAIIEDEETKNKVLDFMHGLTDSPF